MTAPDRIRGESGSLSLESVLVLPVLAMIVVALVQVAALLTDLMLVHEAARAGARAAATTSGDEPVVRAAREAARELTGMKVRVTPSRRAPGDLAQVEVEVLHTFGPVHHNLRATATSRVEPAVGTTVRRSGGVTAVRRSVAVAAAAEGAP